MFQIIPGLPEFVVGIVATGDITRDDFKTVLEPALQKAASVYKGINFLMILETDLSRFTVGAWIMDTKINLAYFFKWNKIAMVSRDDSLQKLINASGLFIPGEVRNFTCKEIEEAKTWICSPG